MPAPQSIVEQTLRVLQERGHRLTGPRRRVVEVAQERPGPFTADELLVDLQRADAGVGRATVFRTLDLLVQHGMLERLHGPNGCHTYVLGHTSNHHHHLICADCGAVVEFEDCNVEPLLGELSRRTNFRISGHWLEVFGTCAACQR